VSKTKSSTRRGKSGRDGGTFTALPHSVTGSIAYCGLSYPARALLLELASQYRGDDNGRLLLERKKLKARGFPSPEVIQRARDQLIAAGFVHETVKGHRPNKASWYAITWQSLDRIPGYDPGAELTFVKGAYRDPLQVKPRILSSSPEQGRVSIGSFPEQGKAPACTAPEPIGAQNGTPPCSPAVHPLEMPSPARQGGDSSPPLPLLGSTAASSSNYLLKALEARIARSAS
jgi:hypothetical protein